MFKTEHKEGSEVGTSRYLLQVTSGMGLVPSLVFLVTFAQAQHTSLMKPGIEKPGGKSINLRSIPP